MSDNCGVRCEQNRGFRLPFSFVRSSNRRAKRNSWNTIISNTQQHNTAHHTLHAQVHAQSLNNSTSRECYKMTSFLFTTCFSASRAAAGSSGGQQRPWLRGTAVVQQQQAAVDQGQRQRRAWTISQPPLRASGSTPLSASPPQFPPAAVWRPPAAPSLAPPLALFPKNNNR